MSTCTVAVQLKQEIYNNLRHTHTHLYTLLQCNTNEEYRYNKLRDERIYICVHTRLRETRTLSCTHDKMHAWIYIHTPLSNVKFNAKNRDSETRDRDSETREVFHNLKYMHHNIHARAKKLLSITWAYLFVCMRIHTHTLSLFSHIYT
jgi:hypothetical protein